MPSNPDSYRDNNYGLTKHSFASMGTDGVEGVLTGVFSTASPILDATNITTQAKTEADLKQSKK